MKRVKIGVISSGGIARCYIHSIKNILNTDIVACASPTKEHVKRFASYFDIKHYFTDYRNMLEIDGLDMVIIGAPNFLHAQMAIDAANAGKHVVCTKPLCMNLTEASKMIEVCKKAKVKLMYGENICFCPKYIKLKYLKDSGALGKVFFIKQESKHDGPPTDWFWDINKSGGWATVDLGCHSFEFFRWFYNNEEIESIYAEMGNFVHKEKGKGDDHSLVIINFKNGLIAMSESSWAKKGGFEDIAVAYGSQGVSYALLPLGMALNTYSEVNYLKDHYITEKTSKGWTYTTYEEEWHYGFPQMFSHFVDCVKNDKEPLVKGDDGKAVLEMLFASYESAKKGEKVYLPFKTDAKKPIDLWLNK
jgi:predicted dehydrogenase